MTITIGSMRSAARQFGEFSANPQPLNGRGERIAFAL